MPLILLAGVLDGLDGAVALTTGRARPLGAVIDSVADRIGDLLLGACLLALGAPVPWVLAAVALLLLLEYVRARAQAVGMPGVGAVTVAERPTRLIVVALAAGGVGRVPRRRAAARLGVGRRCRRSPGPVVGVVGLAQLAARRAPFDSADVSAGPMRSATISADISTRGMPPPGWAEPPTR